MSKKKLPIPGEWWRSNNDDETAFICGFDPDGDPVYMVDECLTPDVSYMAHFLDKYKHEPRCTGFDWKAKPSAKRVPLRMWRDKESGQIVGTLPQELYGIGEMADEVFSDGQGGWEVRLTE